MNKKVIIFDMDGVIFDSLSVAKANILQLHPGITSEELDALDKGNFHEEIKKLAWRRIVETDEEKETRRRIYVEAKSKVPMFDGMLGLIQKLSKEYSLALNTSAVNSNVDLLLKRDGLGELFSFVGTKEVSTSKVEKFKVIGVRFNQKLEEMLFITDTVGDLREANEAGVPTILVTWGTHRRDAFDEYVLPNMIGVVDTVTELEENIGAFFA